MDITVHVPDDMSPFAADLGFFMNTMVRKLHINRHKGYVQGKSLVSLFEGVVGESEELRKALTDESQFAAALEAIDVANQAFLVAAKLLGMNKNDYVQEQKNVE